MQIFRSSNSFLVVVTTSWTYSIIFQADLEDGAWTFFPLFDHLAKKLEREEKIGTYFMSQKSCPYFIVLSQLKNGLGLFHT